MQRQDTYTTQLELHHKELSGTMLALTNSMFTVLYRKLHGGGGKSTCNCGFGAPNL